MDSFVDSLIELILLLRVAFHVEKAFYFNTVFVLNSKAPDFRI